MPESTRERKAWFFLSAWRSGERQDTKGRKTAAPVSPFHQNLHRLFGLVAGAAGAPVVAEASSGIHVIALRSYLNPFAFFSSSFVVFITRYHLLLSLLVARTALNGTRTSFSPIPR